MRATSTLLLGVLLLVCAAAPVRAGEEDPAPLPALDEADRIDQRYLRLSMGGKHAGGVGMRVGTMADGRLLLEMRMLIEVTRSAGGAQDTFTVETRGFEVYDADGNTVATSELTSEAGVTTKVRARYGEGHVDVVHEGPGGTYRKRLELPEDHGTDYAVFKALREVFEADGEAHRAYRSLDAADQDFQPHEMSILRKTTYEHGGKTYPAWRVRQKSEGVVVDLLVGDDYLPFRMTLMGGFLKAEWVDEPPFEVEGGGWAISSMVEVDRAVPRSLDLEELEVLFLLDPPPAADAEPVFEDEPYQTVERVEGGYRMRLHALRPPAGFEPVAFPVATDDAEVRRYLDATPKAQSDHEVIQAAARRLVEDSSDALAAATRIVRWVWAHVAKRSGARGSATALEVLQGLEGDCTEHAVLTVALCRAVGIPARAVGGLVYLVTGEGKPLAGYHAWTEVWVGRWVPVDATIPEVGTSARYARVDIDEPGHPDRAGRVLTALASKTRLEVLAWKHFGGERVEAPAADTTPR